MLIVYIICITFLKLITIIKYFRYSHHTLCSCMRAFHVYYSFFLFQITKQSQNKKKKNKESFNEKLTISCSFQFLLLLLMLLLLLQMMMMLMTMIPHGVFKVINLTNFLDKNLVVFSLVILCLNFMYFGVFCYSDRNACLFVCCCLVFCCILTWSLRLLWNSSYYIRLCEIGCLFLLVVVRSCVKKATTNFVVIFLRHGEANVKSSLRSLVHHRYTYVCVYV